MADELYPDFEVPEIAEEDEEYDTEYKASVKWDPELGDFVRDNSNRLVQCTGEEAYVIWCLKVVQTERDSHMAYVEEVVGEENEIGTEFDDATDDEDQGVVEAMLEQTITDAIEMNPRTEYIGDFDFQWDGDEVHVTFNVKGVNMDDTISISIASRILDE